ncbi:hypothetical protein I5N59_24155 [Serratia marcescens]|uniref:hypothetical protein n=1 Tax=Serratia marcescens TaxID=615 RepID=UPI0018D9C5C1|nr:hypothetical protein [Serratia marcescens]
MFNQNNNLNGNAIVFGYLIDGRILFDVYSGRLLNIQRISIGSGVHSIVIRETMSRLLAFLLSCRDRDKITAYDILFNVWDKYGLQSSNQRLWQAMQVLKSRLDTMGIPDDFIVKTDMGIYKIRGELVASLYL